MDAPSNWQIKAGIRRFTAWLGERGKVVNTFQSFNSKWFLFYAQIEEETGQTIYIDRKNEKRTYIDPRLAFAVENIPQTVAEIRQRFDANSTAFQVLHGKDLTNKVAVITGANTGIGFETAKSLAFFGCRVLMACRSKASTEEAIEKIRKERPVAAERCSFIPVDLGSIQSVKEAADLIKAQVNHIDMLILNAAVFALPYIETEDKLETTFQVCHLSHFYLCEQLVDCLDNRSRVVVVSSESHRYEFYSGKKNILI